MNLKKIKIFALLLSAGFMVCSTSAFSEDKSAADYTEIKIDELNIKADHYTLNMKTYTASFTGDVKVLADNMEMDSQELMVYYKDSGKNSSSDNDTPGIDRIIAKKSVKINIPEHGTANAEEATFFIDNEKILLTGNPSGEFTSGKQKMLIHGGVKSITYDLKNETVSVDRSEEKQAEITINGKDKR